MILVRPLQAGTVTPDLYQLNTPMAKSLSATSDAQPPISDPLHHDAPVGSTGLV